jgi:BirA family biotin operon repressor/biotin-[acetyl-CoA-carboxylase] ligase
MNALPRLDPFYRMLSHDRVGSTNDEAKTLAEAGAPAGTLVWARAQTGGRGRRGRAWVSEPGNLFLSLVLRPECSAVAAAQIGFVASLAVGEACARFLPGDAKLTYKWPNDVLVGGRKIAGILLESQTGTGGGVAWLVVGIGVNLASSPADTEYPATSLAAAGAAAFSPEAVLEALAERFLAWHETWRGIGGFAAVRNAWLTRAQGLGGRIRVRLPGEELQGDFAGLDEDGVLLLDMISGRRRIAAAEIFPAA